MVKHYCTRCGKFIEIDNIYVVTLWAESGEDKVVEMCHSCYDDLVEHIKGRKKLDRRMNDGYDTSVHE